MPRCAYAFVAKTPMHCIVMVKCVNAFIVVVKCGIGNHTAVLHYITIISILNDHPQLDRGVSCYQKNGLSRMLFFKILTAKMESNILLICMHVAS